MIRCHVRSCSFTLLAATLFCLQMGMSPAHARQEKLNIKAVVLDLKAEKGSREAFEALRKVADSFPRVRRGDIFFNLPIWQPLTLVDAIHLGGSGGSVAAFQAFQKAFFAKSFEYCRSTRNGKLFLLANGIPTVQEAENRYRKAAEEAGSSHTEVPPCVEFVQAFLAYPESHSIWFAREVSEIPDLAEAMTGRHWHENVYPTFVGSQKFQWFKINEALDDVRNYSEDDDIDLPSGNATSVFDFQGSRANLTVFAVHHPGIEEEWVTMGDGTEVPRYFALILGIRTLADYDRALKENARKKNQRRKQ